MGKYDNDEEMTSLGTWPFMFLMFVTFHYFSSFLSSPLTHTHSLSLSPLCSSFKVTYKAINTRRKGLLTALELEALRVMK
jgi:hypothetical protein